MSLPSAERARVAAALAPYAERYRRDLVESVVPFWMRHSLDREYGGYFTCLDRDGTVYDTRKYVWLQGRAVWMFARLYNSFERRPEYLAAAELGATFLRRHGRDPHGRYYFSLTREGEPYFYQRKPYGAVFCMIGLLEYGRAAGDQQAIDEAEALFWQILGWIADPTLLGRSSFAGQIRAGSLADRLVVGTMLLELRPAPGDARYDTALRETIAGILRHYDPAHGVFLEQIALDAADADALAARPEGRLFNPGHSIETAWILLRLLELQPDDAARQVALSALEHSLERGWDAEYGGLFYFMDIAGRPTLQIEATMKLWWPHAEAIYTLVLAAVQTGDARWLEWLERVDAYTYARFADATHGEWFGYLDRRGDPALSSKGGSYKGFFHVPRALLFSVQCIEGLAQ